jgi:hypothetical protein
MSSSSASAMHVQVKAIGASLGGAIKPFRPHAPPSTKAALGCVARQWDREALRGPVPQYRGSRIMPELGLRRRVNWSTVLTLTFNFGVWMFMVVALSIVIE